MCNLDMVGRSQAAYNAYFNLRKMGLKVEGFRFDSQESVSVDVKGTFKSCLKEMERNFGAPSKSDPQEVCWFVSGKGKIYLSTTKRTRLCTVSFTKSFSTIV